MVTCECGAEVFIKKTQECRRCYNRRYARERYVVAPINMGLYPAMPPTNPCSYSQAHHRLARWRGRARYHTCQCGAPAESWSYRGDSQHEQEGLVPDGDKQKFVRWSPWIMDYDPLCLVCHMERDGHTGDPIAQAEKNRARWRERMADPAERDRYNAERRARAAVVGWGVVVAGKSRGIREW